jgi:drug/metabolite transporter (DMT)-like permease
MPTMPNWPALLLAPSIAFAHTGVAYALTSPSCAGQDTSTLHVLSICSLLACLLASFGALLNWQHARSLAGPGETPDQSRRRFLSQVATLCGLLSALVVLAEWLPIWMVSPCYG